MLRCTVNLRLTPELARLLDERVASIHRALPLGARVTRHSVAVDILKRGLLADALHAPQRTPLVVPDFTKPWPASSTNEED